MGTVMAKRPKAGGGSEKPKDDRSNRKSAPIQIEKDVAKMAAMVATYRSITMSDLCTPVLRPFITMQYRLLQEEMARGLKDEQPGG
jgi:hypothetical protein